MSFKKENRRKRIHQRIRKKVRGTAQRPRLSVYRSNRDIYAQLIDDVSGHTLLSASSREKDVAKDVSKVEQAKQVGKIMGERIQASKVAAIVFDRGGYLYHGRVKALAEGVREAGIQI